ncbi:MAG TPA: PRC-barrel domain-containing protein [Candidatus Sulfotelmatobacter sp.]|nr:PRC-barrel domain-containing protein [Candidatus Sulfotelmatobacter sp.]
MAHYGTLKDISVADAADDIRGSHLYGLNDEKLGKIDDVIFDHSTGDIRYVVVDTGGWLSTKKFLVPADGLRASTKHENDFQASLDKRQIENFPPYNESDLESESKWAGYEGRYRSKWVADPVMHRDETDRNITPTTLQESGNRASENAAARTQGRVPLARSTPAAEASRADLEAAAAPTERIVPAGSDSVVISNSAVGIGGRWDTFQSRLRERRKEAVTHCNTCTGESAMKRGSESVDTLRKAV